MIKVIGLNIKVLKKEPFSGSHQGMRFFKNFDNRGGAITTATEFPPNPNMFSCRWCPYGPRGTGHCDKGV